MFEVGFSISAPINWTVKKSQNIRGNVMSFFSSENTTPIPDAGISIDPLTLLTSGTQ